MSVTMTQPTGTVEHIDPSLVVLEDNIRVVTPEDLDAGFVESIRQNGVIQPVVGWRDSAGVVQVRYGQRRTVGARVAGVATIPVYVTDVNQADEAQRIVEQLVENEQRADLSVGEKVEAWRQLELAGLSVTTIAKRTGSKRADVKAGVTVAKNETGARLIGEAGLDLHQAAELLEFADDSELVEELTGVAISDPDFFPHAVVQARQEREARVKREATEQAEAAKGVRILDEHPGYDGATVPLHALRTGTGEEVTGADLPETGVAARILVRSGEDARVQYFIDDPEKHGFTIARGYGYGPDSFGSAAKGPMTDEQKAERKTLIANNKAWAAAEVVRREWATKFLARKSMPRDTAAVLAALFGGANGRRIARGISDSRAIAKTLLNLDAGYGSQLAEYAVAHPTKALHATVAVTLGSIEQTTSKGDWRYPDDEVAEYLQILAAWGYPLSPVEKIAAKIAEVPEVDDATEDPEVAEG